MAASELRSPIAPRLISVQGLRGVAVIVVILVHLHHTETRFVADAPWIGAWNAICIAGVDIFFVVSGFVLTHLAMGHFAQPGHVAAYAYARISRVYPMYILLTVLLLPVYLAKPLLFNATEGHEVSLWRSLLLIPDVKLPLIPVAWTLHHEMYFYVVLGVMLLVPQRYLLHMIAAWAMVTAGLAAWGQAVPRAEQGAFERVLFNPINAEFVLGMFAAWAFTHLPRNGSRWIAWAAALWAALGVAIWYGATGLWWVSDFWRVWVYGVPATVLVWNITARESEGRGAFMRRLAWVGDGAYSIYLTHLMVLVVFGRLWQAAGFTGVAAHAAFLVLSMVAALGLGYGAFTHVEAPIMRWARRRDPTRHRVIARVAAAR